VYHLTVMECRRHMEYRICLLHFSGTGLDMCSPFFFFGDIWSIEYVYSLSVGQDWICVLLFFFLGKMEYRIFIFHFIGTGLVM